MQTLLSLAKEAQANEIDQGAIERERAREVVRKRQERARKLLAVEEKIAAELSEIIGAPAEFYHWLRANNGYSMYRHNCTTFAFKQCRSSDYSDRTGRGEEYTLNGCIENLDTGIMRKRIDMLFADSRYILQVFIFERAGKFTFEIHNDTYNKSEAAPHLKIERGHVWTNRTPVKPKQVFNTKAALVKALKALCLKIIDVPRLTKLVEQVERREVLASYLKINVTDTAPETDARFKDACNVVLEANGKKYHVLTESERFEFTAETVKNNPAKYFDLELAAKHGRLGLQDLAKLRDSLSQGAQSLILNNVLTLSEYAKAYAERHTIGDAIAPFGKHFIVDCGKL